MPVDAADSRRDVEKTAARVDRTRGKQAFATNEHWCDGCTVGRGLIHEGNVRRVLVQHQGRTIAEFPLTAGVVGAVLAPVAAAIAPIVALLKDCTIHVERVGVS